MSATGPSVPWWASGDGEEHDLDDDPVMLHRAARRGRPTSGESDGTAHDPDVCDACPICAGLRLLGETHPDLLEHVTEAARHLAAAARVLLEPPAASADEPGERDRSTRIDVE